MSLEQQANSLSKDLVVFGEKDPHSHRSILERDGDDEIGSAPLRGSHVETASERREPFAHDGEIQSRGGAIPRNPTDVEAVAVVLDRAVEHAVDLAHVDSDGRRAGVPGHVVQRFQDDAIDASRHRGREVGQGRCLNGYRDSAPPANAVGEELERGGEPAIERLRPHLARDAPELVLDRVEVLAHVVDAGANGLRNVTNDFRQRQVRRAEQLARFVVERLRNRTGLALEPVVNIGPGVVVTRVPAGLTDAAAGRRRTASVEHARVARMGVGATGGVAPVTWFHWFS